MSINTELSKIEKAEQFAKEIGCPLEAVDVMVSIGLSAQYTNGKTIADVKGLGKYPRTDLGKFILATVDNAMAHVAYIKSLPEETKTQWSKLGLKRCAVGFRLQQMERFERSVSRILRNPTDEQKPLIDEYNALSEQMAQIELQPSLF